MNKNLGLFYILFCLFIHSIFGQQAAIKGVVTDGTMPLPGANIIIKGTQSGATTDFNGNFEIQGLAPVIHSITISYVGFMDKIIEVDLSITQNKDLGTIDLIPSAQALDEVVVTAIGIEREVKALGYAAQTIKSNDITEAKDVNLLNNLSGKISGVQIVQGPTGVGSSAKIVIRSETSFNSNDPLFILDGNPIFNNSIINPTREGILGVQAIDYGNAAGEISPDDIASVTVLKGAGATALYGARGANGVVVLETKSGNKEYTVEYNANFQVASILTTPKYQNTYGQGINGQFEFGDGFSGGVGLNDDEDQSWGPAFSENISIAQFDGPSILPDGTIVRGADIYARGYDPANPSNPLIPITPTPWEAQPDNVKDFFNTGFTSIHNIAIGKSFDKGKFRLSYTSLDSESSIPNSNLIRNSLFLKSTYELSDKVSVKGSFNYINTSSDNRPANGYGSENLMYVFTWFGRSVNLSNLKEYWQRGYEGREQFNYNYAWHDNPYFTVRENINPLDKNRLLGNVTLNYGFNKGWTLTGRIGLDYYNEFRPQHRAYSSKRFPNGGYIETNTNGLLRNLDILVKHNRKLSDHIEFTGTLGVNTFSQNIRARTLSTNNLAVPNIYSFSNAASPIENYELSQSEKQNSIYGLIQFAYKNQLYIDISGRNDWSSTLASSENLDQDLSFFYPALSASWILSKSFELPKEFSFLKLRASIAQIGNDTMPNLTKNLFNNTGTYNSQPYSYLTTNAGNPNLKPERSTSFEVGTDIRLFQSRLQLDLAYYNTLAEDQIIALPVATSSGLTTKIENGGSIRSQGIEAILSARPIQEESFKWETSFNFSRNRAIVASLPDGFDSYTISYARVYDNSSSTVWVFARKGERIGNMYGTGFLKDENGNDVYNIDSNGNVEPIKDPNLRLLGNYNPDFTLGWNNHFKYKNFDVSFLWDWRQGGTIVSRQLSLASTSGNLDTTAYRPQSGIVPNGTVLIGYDSNGNPQTRPFTQNETMNAVRYYKSFYDRDNEDNHKYDASFLKLRQIAIGYSFHKKTLGNLFQELRVSLIGRNLLLFTQNPHFDPEVLAVQGQNFVPGVEDMALPSERTIGININAKF